MSWMKSDSSMNRNCEENVTQHMVQGTQTSKTVLELAMLELNEIHSDTYIAKVSNHGTPVHQLELDHDHKTSSPRAEHCTLPRLSRFTIREIRVKSVDKSSCVQKDDGAMDASNANEDPSLALSVASGQPMLSSISSARRARSISPCTHRTDSQTTITDTPVTLEAAPAPTLVTTSSTSTCDMTCATLTDYTRPVHDSVYILMSHLKSRDW